MLQTIRRRTAFAALLLALVPLAACSDDATDPDEHDELPEFMELTIGANTVRVNGSGTIVAGTLPTLREGVNATVTFRFLADDGDVLNLDDDYEVRGTSTATALLTFTSTGRLTGTLVPLDAGQATVRFSLFHRAENHEDWGPHNVAFTITP